MNCSCCDKEFVPTITEDIATFRCLECGFPYWWWYKDSLYTPAVSPVELTWARTFWNTKRSLVFPADYQITRLRNGDAGLVDCTLVELKLWNSYIMEGA